MSEYGDNALHAALRKQEALATEAGIQALVYEADLQDIRLQETQGVEKAVGGNAARLVGLMREHAGRQLRGGRFRFLLGGPTVAMTFLSDVGKPIDPSESYKFKDARYIASPFFEASESYEPEGTIRTGWQLHCRLNEFSGDDLDVYRVAERNGLREISGRFLVRPHMAAGNIVDSLDREGNRDDERRRLREIALGRIAPMSKDKPSIVARMVTLAGGVKDLVVGTSELDLLRRAVKVSAESLTQREMALSTVPLAGPTATLECLRVTQVALQEVFGE